MLLTLRHLADITIRTHDPKKSSTANGKKPYLENTSYDALLALGLRINQLDWEKKRKHTAPVERQRLRDKLKAKLKGQ